MEKEKKTKFVETVQFAGFDDKSHYNSYQQGRKSACNLRYGKFAKYLYLLNCPEILMPTLVAATTIK